MTDSTTKPTIVLGLGNPLMADEGIGTELIARLQKHDLPPDVEIADAGTGGMALLHYFENRKKAVIFDCCLMDEEPATIKRFTPDDVTTVKKLAHISLHETDILNVIKIAKQLNDCPEQIIFFGIQPVVIEPRIGISTELSEKIDEYTQHVLKEISK